MKIIKINKKRILIKENKEIDKEIDKEINKNEIDISNGNIVEYTGIYYKNIKNIIKLIKIETKFIGVIENHKYRHDTGIIGIYIKPLFIYYNDRWNKIINYKDPIYKYFFYPHLLVLPDKYYHYHPLYFIDTIENKNLIDIDINNFSENNFDLEL